MMRKIAARPRERVLAAVSGGADSVALLRMLHALSEAGEIELFAAHFEHGIRGAQSEADAAFVEALCARFRVPLTVGHADVPAYARARGLGLEEAAREARYAFLRKVKRDVGADCIALAHHLDDQAETVLMHLLRGASLRGAGGMRERDGDLFRPLLDVAKKELLEYLAEIGQDFREDETNAACDNPRNILRLRALPEMRKAYPAAETALARFAALARRDEDCLSALAAEYARENVRETPFGFVVRQTDAHPAVRSRALAALAPMDASGVERALALGDGDKINLPGMTLSRRGNRLYLTTKPYDALGETPLAPGETVRAAQGETSREPGETVFPTAVFRVSGAPCEPVRDEPLRQRLSAAALVGARVRTRRSGDRFKPLGAPGHRKLSDCLLDARIDREARDFWPLIARGNEILWIPGVAVSDEARLSPGVDAVEIVCRFTGFIQFVWEGMPNA